MNNYKTTMREIEVLLNVLNVSSNNTDDDNNYKLTDNKVKMTIDLSVIIAYSEIILIFNKKETKHYTRIITNNDVFICCMEYNEFKTMFGDIIDSINQMSVTENTNVTPNTNISANNNISLNETF